ncbi:MAG: serpin family protein [Chlamydiia bacterium]
MRLRLFLSLLTCSLVASPPDCRQLPPMARAAAVSAGLNLGIELLQLAPAAQSSVLSNFMIEEMVHLLAEGARGRTRQELTRLVPENVSARALRCLTQEWQHPPAQDQDASPGEKSLTVEFAGHAWIAPQFPVKPSFGELLENDFQWGISSLLTQPNAAVQEVNKWVSSQTHGVIENLFPPTTINEQTQLVLACTTYLKGSWAIPFSRDLTQPDTFTLSDGKTRQAPFMQKSAFMDVAERQNETVVLVPIAGANQRWALMLVLPKRRSAQDVLMRLRAAEISQWLASPRQTYTELHLPRFRLSSEWDLAQTLEAVNIKLAFTPQADFTGISDVPGLHVGALLHQAVLEVNEDGLLATAAVGGAMQVLSAREPPTPLVVRFDRPFLCGVVDRTSGALLFLGICQQPETL